MTPRCLCVGGPRAGRYVDHHGEYYRVPVYTGKVPHWPDSQTDPNATFKTFTYRRVVGLRGDIEIDFWVPEERATDNTWQNNTWAINHIIESYIGGALND